MVFTLSSSSGTVRNAQVDIISLKDLKNLSEKYNGNSLIIDFIKKSIEIYDTWRE